METLDLWPPPRSRPPRILIAVGILAVVLIVGAGIALQQPIGDRRANRQSPTPTVSKTSLPTRSATTDPDRPRTWRIDPFLADLDLDLVAIGGGQLYRIQTKRRQVTATRTPALNSSPVTIVVSPGQVLVRDWSQPAFGYVVPHGRPSQKLPQALSSPQQVLAGPPGRLWVTTAEKHQTVTRLTDLAGRPVRTTSGPSEYRGLENLVEDRTGGLLLSSVGGTYVISEKGPRRITRGRVVAVGPRHVLASDCTETLQCGRYLVTRRTGEHRRVGPTTVNDYADGSLSDDGRYAALWSWSDQGAATLVITDLQTNATLARVAEDSGSANWPSLHWLPDNRLLGVRDGRIFLFDPASRRITSPELEIGRVDQISVRVVAR